MIESMEAWSPYASNYDNPIRYEDFLGDEPEDSGPGPILHGLIISPATSAEVSQEVSTIGRYVLISVGSTLNGALNSFTFGTWPMTPGGSSGYSEADMQNVESSANLGALGATFALIPHAPGGGVVIPNAKVPSITIPTTLPLLAPFSLLLSKKEPKDLLKDAKDSQAKEAASRDRTAKREQATSQGKTKKGEVIRAQEDHIFQVLKSLAGMMPQKQEEQENKKPPMLKKKLKRRRKPNISV